MAATRGILSSIATTPKAHHRRRLFIIFGVVLLLAAALFIGWWTVVGSRSVSTDNAYVDAEVARVSAQTSGTVLKVLVDETQIVHTGDVLVLIDPADAQLAVDQAEADYDRAIRRVRQYVAESAASAADVKVAQSRLTQAKAELHRRQNLASSGAVSGEELTTADAGFESATHALTSARGQAAKHEAMIDGADLQNNPEVRAARVALESARLMLARTTIRAPISGIIAEKRVALAQRVQVGAPLLTVVPIESAYVNANFKENQLRRVRIGQSVKLTSDLYGSEVEYHGRVVGVGGGTGAAFAVIPAQNASGNWIKIVQRVPVRIQIDPKEMHEHLLRVGLSMTAEIELQ